MKKITFLFLFLTVAFLPAAFAGKNGGSVPPKLMTPADDADLHGKKELQFHWSSQGSLSGSTYDFRIFKGTQTIESGLILKKELPMAENTLSLPADMFEDGQSYAWSMRVIGAQKSRPAYSIFKVRK